MDDRRKFPFFMRMQMFLRSFTLQASWNSQRMQNLGLLFCLLPLLRRQGGDPNHNRLFCRRHYVFFNTNPYLANVLLGGLVKLEDAHHLGDPVPQDMISTYRDSLGRALASLGDQVFWLGLRPAVVMACCLLGLLGSGKGVLVLITLFGLLQMGLRWVSLASGFALGRDILGVLRHPWWHRLIGLAKKTGMVLTGLVAGVYLGRVGNFQGGGQGVAIWVGVGLGLALPTLLKKRFPGEIMLLLALVLAGAVSFANRVIGS